ncbi:monovalent cation/H(+) antiporter subunit G [Devosia rhizoryzae]|uniref:Cation:proton antiporter n=1 Tax=Devosia rhizoryzae TaxID=2774137 RepID=A0ABX7C3I6_9HYPH|nr:monovalent cation/H(+) antiporter subunit G [Devosia rhizoryzae]QQR38646.1 cation:proton antiporter [Devosia rhizoryzae]
MSFDDIPLWVAILVAACVLTGAILTFAGAVGLARMPSFYQRIHAPTLGTSFGALGVLAASAILSSVGEGRFVAHEVLIFIFVSVTTPVTLMLLARAALHRDRVEGSSEVPAAIEKPIDQ